MDWNVTMESSHGVKLSKDKHSEQLVLGLVSSGLSPVSQGAYVETQKRPRRQAMANWLEDPDSDDMCDDLSNPVEKKRRLTVEQVQFLEMSFNVDVKLEPERKALIAKQLGLRPRQVAIWFQNRRVRWKNKQLEQDYEVLKSKYDTLVKHNSTVLKEKEAAEMENEKLKAEVAHLTALLQSSRNHVVVSEIIDASMVKVTALPDFDSDSESGSKEDVTSASKSCEPADTQDSCRSDPPTEGVVLAIVDPPYEEMNSLIAVKVEAENFFLDESSANSYNPFLYLNGCFVDDPLAGIHNHLDSYGLGDDLDYSGLCLGI